MCIRDRPPERYAEKTPKKKKNSDKVSEKPNKHSNLSNQTSSASKKDKKSQLKQSDKNSHRKKMKEPKIPPLSSKVKKLITSSDEDDDDDDEDDDVEPMDTEDDNYSTPLEGIRKTSDKSSSYHRQHSAPHVHFEVTSSHPTSSQYSPALSTASTSSSASSPNSLAKKIGITIKKSPNSDRTFETSLLGLSIDKDEEEGRNNKTKKLSLIHI